VATAAPGHRRPVGTLALLALGVNGIVGVGIFFAPAEIARNAGGWPSVFIFALVGLVLLPVAASFSILGRRFDEDGGPVVFARAAFGELPSFFVGWIAYVSAIASTTAVHSGLTAAVAPALGIPPGVPTRLASALLATMLALVCALGIKLSARVWTALTVLKLVPLVALVAAFALSGFAASTAPSPTQLSSSWLRAALLATFAYQGFEIVPVVAGQVHASARAIPIAVAGSLGVSASLYVALQAACVASVVGLAASGAPLADAARALGGTRLAHLVSAGTSVSALGIAFGMMAMTPRYLSALAAGGRQLPLAFERTADNGVPLRALFLTWLLVSLLLQGGELSEFFALSGVTVLLQYGVTALSLLALARRRERGLAPRDAWPVLPTVLVTLALASGAHAREVFVAAAALVCGLGLRAVRRSRG
jgi:amino acid transporter